MKKIYNVNKVGKFYKIVNFLGYVLSNQYNISAERVLGYGGVWVKDHRKAKRFKTLAEVKKEIKRIPFTSNYLIVKSGENWKEAYKERKGEL